jgi:hypothetical protein
MGIQLNTLDSIWARPCLLMSLNRATVRAYQISLRLSEALYSRGKT